MQLDREYRGTDADLIKFKKGVIKHRDEIKTMFSIEINPAASSVAIANQLLSILGLKLNQVSRDKLPDGKAGHRVYKFMPILVTDIRYQILQNWLKVDAQKMAQKMPEIIDMSSIELDPPKVIINSITDTGSELTGSIEVMVIATNPEYDNDEWKDMPNLEPLANPATAIAPSPPKTPNAPTPNSKPSNKPSAPPKNAIHWQKDMSAMYQGTDWVIGMLGTATAKIVRNGFELWVDIVYLKYA